MSDTKPLIPMFHIQV